jgi:hypothetical protein
MTTPTEPYNDSIQETVARETARRKRVFLAFMALLLVPIAIGAYALAKAPSDTEKVVTDVTPIVAERVGGQIATRVTDDVVKQTEPLIRDNVSRAIATDVEPRIATAANALRQDITNLQTTAQKTSEFVAAATPQLSSISGFEDRLVKLDGSMNQTQGLFQALKSDQEGLRQDFATEREFTRGLPKEMNRVSAQVTNESTSSRQQLNDLRQTMTKELDSIRSLVNTSVQAANANKEAIGGLARRILAVEAELKRLQERVKAFEAKAQQIR